MKYIKEGGIEMSKPCIRKGFVAVIMVTLLLGSFGISNVGAQEYNTKDLNEQLVMATLWYQRSAEMRALSYQAFNMAKLVYDMDLKIVASDKKRAVIVDVDETVLDNGPYEAGLIDQNYGYSKGWGEWCDAGEAPALPGAVEFLNYVANNGGDVFYVTNRKVKYRAGTMKNLKMLGFPQVEDSHVLLREKTSDKEPRRQLVRDSHRIVLLMGDNLNDFESVFRKKGNEERAAAVDALKDKFGIQFIVLPNPMYGDWEGAVYNFNWGMTPAEKSKARKAALIRWNLP
jgi:5'-nucleotidase (lipoprotein e(P4) family)